LALDLEASNYKTERIGADVRNGRSSRSGQGMPQSRQSGSSERCGCLRVCVWVVVLESVLNTCELLL